MTNEQRKAKLLQLISLHCESAIANAEKGGGHPAAIYEIQAQFANCSRRLFDFIQNELFAEPVKIAIPARHSGATLADALAAAREKYQLAGTAADYMLKVDAFMDGYFAAVRRYRNAKD